MSVNFSTIRPMDPATISRKPKYSTEAETPVASTPVIGKETSKKKSHTLLKTVAGLVVLVGAAALLRKNVDMFKNIKEVPALAENAGTMDIIKNYGEKALYYGKQGVAYVGDFVNKYAEKGYDYVRKLIPKAEAQPVQHKKL